MTAVTSVAFAPPAALPAALPAAPPASSLHLRTRTPLPTPRPRPRARAALATPPPPTRPPSRPQDDKPPSPSTPLSGQPALQAALHAVPPDALVVVFFHARWCRVCKTLWAKLPSVASQFPRLVWFDVDFAERPNKPLCSQLNVKLLPTFRLFRGGSDVDDPLDSFTTGPFGAKRLVERLEVFCNPRLPKL